MEEPWQGIQDYSIDLYEDELAQPIENFIPIYRRAKEERLCLKAHIGEWGTAEFGRDLSKEYLKLFEAGCLNAEELDQIRLNGLREM